MQTFLNDISWSILSILVCTIMFCQLSSQILDNVVNQFIFFSAHLCLCEHKYKKTHIAPDKITQDKIIYSKDQNKTNND